MMKINFVIDMNWSQENLSEVFVNQVFVTLQIIGVIIWRPPSLNELTPYYISSELTHLGSEASISVREIDQMIANSILNCKSFSFSFIIEIYNTVLC